MKIRKETTFILENEHGVQALAPVPGQNVELAFPDGTYHAGEVSEITERAITISRSDGDYTYEASEIADIKMASF